MWNSLQHTPIEIKYMSFRSCTHMVIRYILCIYVDHTKSSTSSGEFVCAAGHSMLRSTSSNYRNVLLMCIDLYQDVLSRNFEIYIPPHRVSPLSHLWPTPHPRFGVYFFFWWCFVIVKCVWPKKYPNHTKRELHLGNVSFMTHMSSNKSEVIEERIWMEHVKLIQSYIRVLEEFFHIFNKLVVCW